MTAVMGLGLLASLADPSSAATTQPAGGEKVQNGWSGTLYEFQRPRQLIVEEATPTAEQVNWRQRPPAMKPDAPQPKATGPAKPALMGDFNVVHLRFKDAEGDVVPALLCTPRNKNGPFPLVLAVHGITSNKAQVCAQVAPALTKRGFAVLAADMPAHGERPGDPKKVIDWNNPVRSFSLARQAVNDVRQCIDLAEARGDLDVSGGVTLVGYSMGSWINSVVGPLDTRVNALVLMVGGAMDIPAAALLIPQIAATDPRLALAHFAGRPILMMNGRRDFTVTADMGKRLFSAAPEPKEQRWYDCGHLLTQEAYEDAAEWVAKSVRRAKDQNARGEAPRQRAEPLQKKAG
jgi:fermentation-respiration switch protein FrsA (DUF1100 family)